MIEQLISVTELQKNTKSCLSDIDSAGKKVIVSNNKPKAILLSLYEFAKISKKGSHIPEADADEWEKSSIAEYEQRKKTGKVANIRATESYFNKLK